MSHYSVYHLFSPVFPFFTSYFPLISILLILSLMLYDLICLTSSTLWKSLVGTTLICAYAFCMANKDSVCYSKQG